MKTSKTFESPFLSKLPRSVAAVGAVVLASAAMASCAAAPESNNPPTDQVLDSAGSVRVFADGEVTRATDFNSLGWFQDDKAFGLMKTQLHKILSTPAPKGQAKETKQGDQISIEFPDITGDRVTCQADIFSIDPSSIIDIPTLLPSNECQIIADAVIADLHNLPTASQNPPATVPS